jgi:hypothetical protein
MLSGVARVPAVLVAAACLVTACSVTRQRVDLAVRGDVPVTDSKARKAGASPFARQVTAAFRCPSNAGGDRGPQACWEMAQRPDRDVVGGPLGVAASTLPGVECADVCTKKQISIEPIMTKLGRPPYPSEFARRLAPSGPTNDRLRDVVRRAYEEAVRARYRQYAHYIDQELAEADYVEIGPAGGGATRRYGSGRIYQGLDEALGEIADSYAALQWARFDREWGRASPRSAPARDGSEPESPPAPKSPAAPAPAEKAEETVATPGAGQQTEKASARSPTAVAGGDDVRCRRSCSLRYRACLARCRDQPISGGEYDACAYECSDGSLTCRGTCGPLASP